jgi:hypothetical protein
MISELYDPWRAGARKTNLTNFAPRSTFHGPMNAAPASRIQHAAPSSVARASGVVVGLVAAVDLDLGLGLISPGAVAG